MGWLKKISVIEAVEFKDTADCIAELSELGLDPVVVSYSDPENPFIKIDTLEGDHKAMLGDYIIKGVKGEFYPCKPDIFKMTYELAEGGE